MHTSKQNTTDNSVSHNGINYSSQDTTALQPSVFLAGSHRLLVVNMKYRICSRNLRTFFPILAAEKSRCVKYADFFCGGLDLGFILV